MSKLGIFDDIKEFASSKQAPNLKWVPNVLSHEVYDKMEINHIKQILKITNETHFLNKVLFLESLYGWGDNIKYDKGTFENLNRFVSLREFGYNQSQPNFVNHEKILIGLLVIFV